MESRGLHKSAQGQSIVEFALVLPLLLIIIVGVFDLGRAFFALITINNAAREGARYATLHLDETVANIQTVAANEAQGSGLIVMTSDVFVSCPDDGVAFPCNPGTAVRVTVRYTFRSLLNFIIQSQFIMQRSIEMAVPK